MKQYEQLFFVCDKKDATDWVNEDIPVQYMEDKIVLTLEELRELWNTAYHNGIDREKGKDVPLHFEAYLQSKGIQL